MTTAFFRSIQRQAAAKVDFALLQSEPYRKTKAVHALTSSASNEAYTPPDVLEAARHALGGTIDLDPASCAVANEEVRAGFIYTADTTRAWDGSVNLLDGRTGGLFLPWGHTDQPNTVWCNPPGGFVNRDTLLPAKRGMSSCCAWWYTALNEYRAGRVKAACFYTFRLDVLQNIQAYADYEPPQAFPFCILKARPRHWSTGTPRELRGKRGQPTHACAVFFLPERLGGVTSAGVNRRSVDRFVKAFSPLGYVRC